MTVIEKETRIVSATAVMTVRGVTVAADVTAMTTEGETIPHASVTGMHRLKTATVVIADAVRGATTEIGTAIVIVTDDDATTRPMTSAVVSEIATKTA